MRIVFAIIAAAALAVGIWALCKEEYIIAFGMLFVLVLQIFNLIQSKGRRYGR